MKSNTRTLLWIAIAAIALIVALFLVSCATGPVSAEVVAGVTAGIAVLDQLLASGTVTPEQHAVLVASLKAAQSGWSTEAIVGVSVAATKALDGAVAYHKHRKNKKRAASPA